MKYDVVVIGSGISGMRAAIEAKELGANVVLITKSSVIANNSFMAKGGINAAFGNMGDGDNIFQHGTDTYNSSMEIGNEESIRIFCEQAPAAVRDLLHYGVKFTKLENNKLAQRPFGGSKFRRTIYAADETGPAIMKALHQVIKNYEIDVIKNHMVMNLIVKDNIISGVTLFDEEKEKVSVCEGKSVIIATGGFASLYKRFHSNVKDATGDGIAIGMRAGLRAINLEFVQFHPTGFEGTNFLVSEAVRAEGGKIVDENGESFVDELNTRDFVTRAIFKELQKGHKVYVDMRNIPEDVINTKLIGIKKRAYTLKKLDVTKDLIPVTPVTHHTMGGIETDAIGRTSIEGLFVVGEAGDNGVNGANRLGGNSLSQGAVFGKISAYEAIKFAYKVKKFNGVDYYDIMKDIQLVEKLKELAQHTDANELKNEIGQTLFKKVGIIRTGVGLKKAMEKIEEVESAIETPTEGKSSNVQSMLELLNGILVAKALIKSATMREESRGSHFRIDFPETDRKFQNNTLITIDDL